MSCARDLARLSCRRSVATLRAALIIACGLLLGGGGCSKSDEQGPAQRLVETLGKADLKTEGFEQAAAKPYAAQQCLRGKVEQLDVLVCGYADEASAKAAEPKLKQFIGSAVTGLVRQQGAAALVAVDRDKKDLQGKTLNKVSEAVQGS